ncbi:MAG: hypothetical protein EU529_03075 [Promethearchaeota archaeon]|nr:MAG: hypothetical protein EU529_03075 [Candidatus Lokiarchaeota archaeon]
MSVMKEKIKKKMENARIKNMVRGAIFAGIYILITIIIPFMTFSWIMRLEVEGLDLELYEEQYAQILFFVIAFGLLISGTAFFGYSAPAQSIRRGIFSLIQIILNLFYLWSYKFSGALEIEVIIVDLGIVEINLQQLILTYIGIYFLTVILKAYDLIDFIINRDKIKFERGQK